MVFNYVFVLEEFLEYLIYYDVFGFFILGKGIVDVKDIKLSLEVFGCFLIELDLLDVVFIELKNIFEKLYINCWGYVGVFC